jgi:myosin heavy subunit
MEKEIGSSLEREDRESVFDDVVAPDPSLEGIDYETYLKIERGEMTIEEWKRESSLKVNSEESRPWKRKSNISSLEEAKTDGEGDKRVKRVTVVTTEDVWKLLKIVAAAEGKTVSTYLNDFILESLKEKLKQADSYNKLSAEIIDSG